ncbi:MAG: hypothetical protein FWH14_07295 [Oscillospiraceae bacterium]|nr:hypothetical protein [Oscillospiraceae bacterium]
MGIIYHKIFAGSSVENNNCTVIPETPSPSCPRMTEGGHPYCPLRHANA